MKIAITTEDKINISEHFGGAPYFMVIRVEEGEVLDREVRNKPGHEKYASEEGHPQVDVMGKRGFGSQASKRHEEMHETIKDCNVLITGRVGFEAYSDMQGFGNEGNCYRCKKYL